MCLLADKAFRLLFLELTSNNKNKQKKGNKQSLKIESIFQRTKGSSEPNRLKAEEKMWKNQDFFTPMKSWDSCKERQRKYSQRNAMVPLWNEANCQHCVCASTALTRVKALQKIFYLNLFPKHPRIPWPRGALSPPPGLPLWQILFSLLCLEKGWKVARIDCSACTSQANTLYGNTCSCQGLPWELKVCSTSLDRYLLLPLVIIMKGRGRNNTATLRSVCAGRARIPQGTRFCFLWSSTK